MTEIPGYYYYYYADTLTAMTGLRRQMLYLCLKTGHDCFLTFFPISLFAVIESLSPEEESQVLTAVHIIILKTLFKLNLMSHEIV